MPPLHPGALANPFEPRPPSHQEIPTGSSRNRWTLPHAKWRRPLGSRGGNGDDLRASLGQRSPRPRPVRPNVIDRPSGATPTQFALTRQRLDVVETGPKPLRAWRSPAGRQASAPQLEWLSNRLRCLAQYKVDVRIDRHREWLQRAHPKAQIPESRRNGTFPTSRVSVATRSRF